jgi:sodium transport system permease protein
MVLLGAFYPAIDVTAGERERGTLETVLCSPIRRFDLMLGKVLAVATLAALTGVLNLGSMAITLMQVLRLAAHNVVLDVPWGNALLSSLVIVPAALLFAAAFVALGATARTFKEAQTLLLPAYFLTLAPAMAGAIGEYQLAGLAAWVPGMNMTLLARDLLVGRATWAGALQTIASTVLLGTMALAAAARIYDSENFVDPPSRRLREAAGVAPATSAGDALVLFALAFLLLYFVFLPIEQHHLAAGLLLAEWLGLFGLVFLYARLSGHKLAATIGLARPSARAVLGAVLVGGSAWAAVAIFSDWLLPAPKHLLEELRRSVFSLESSHGLPLTLVLMAASPAICEEALFRGPILRGLRTRLSPAAAAVGSGILFGLFHLDLYRLIPTTVLGTLLGFIALGSGSIVPAMLAHFCNNAILLVLATGHFEERMANLSHRTLTLIVCASVTLTAIGCALLRRKGPKGEM